MYGTILFFGTKTNKQPIFDINIVCFKDTIILDLSLLFFVQIIPYTVHQKTKLQYEIIPGYVGKKIFLFLL